MVVLPLNHVRDYLQKTPTLESLLAVFKTLSTVKNETHLQKLIFAAQELKYINKIYTFGLDRESPFSSELDLDLALLSSFNDYVVDAGDSLSITKKGRDACHEEISGNIKTLMSFDAKGISDITTVLYLKKKGISDNDIVKNAPLYFLKESTARNTINILDSLRFE